MIFGYDEGISIFNRPLRQFAEPVTNYQEIATSQVSLSGHKFLAMTAIYLFFC